MTTTSIIVDGHEIDKSYIYHLLTHSINEYFNNTRIVYNDYIGVIKTYIECNNFEHDYVVAKDGYYIPYEDVYKNYLKDHWGDYSEYVNRKVHNKCVSRGIAIDKLPTRPTDGGIMHDDFGSSGSTIICVSIAIVGIVALMACICALV